MASSGSDAALSQPTFNSSIAVPRNENLFPLAIRIDQDDLEKIIEATAEVRKELVLEFWARLTSVGFNCGDVVLADAEFVRELPLREATLLPHRLEPDGPNLDPHTRAFIRLADLAEPPSWLGLQPSA